MTVRGLTIELPRIAGEAEFVAISEEGRIIKAFFIPVAPIRGFEKLVRGKNPLFVIEAVKRICGFCHSSHGIASAEAFEEALGIYPPKDGFLLREAIGLLNRVQSHLAHLALITPDFIPKDKAFTFVLDVLRLLEQVNAALTRVGGAPTHPPNIVIGGVSKPPTQSNLTATANGLKNTLVKVNELLQVIMDEDKWAGKARALKERKFTKTLLATHLTYGDKYALDLSKVRLVRYAEVHAEDPEAPEHLIKKATTLVASYGGEYVEVGPRARMSKFRGFNGSSLADIQLARLAEIPIALERVLNLLSEVNVKAPTRVEAVIYRQGEGVGVYEAPRGTLIHRVKLGKDGRVESYSIIVPTEFLVPLIEEAAVGVPEEAVDAVPRVFDPCVPCTTHVLRLR